VRISIAGQAHGFFDFATVSLIPPDQQVGDSARILEIASSKPGRDNRDALAVDSRPDTEKVAVPCSPLSSALLHRQTPVFNESMGFYELSISEPSNPSIASKANPSVTPISGIITITANRYFQVGGRGRGSVNPAVR
jgi:hypothetical protein